MKHLLLSLVLVFTVDPYVTAMSARAAAELCDWGELPVVIHGDGFDLVKLEANAENRRLFYETTDSDVRAMLDFSDDPAIFNGEFDVYFAVKPLAYWIKDHATSNVVGSISIHQTDCPYGQGDLCYWLCEEVRGKGFVTKAIALMSNLYFKHLPKKESYVAYVLEKNSDSKNVLKRAGFKQYCSEAGVLEDKTPAGTLRWLAFRLTREDFFRAKL